MNEGPGSKRLRPAFSAALLFAVGTACLYRPPIATPPEELDQPPLVRLLDCDEPPEERVECDIDPPNNQLIRIDRSFGERVVFELLEVRDPRPDGVIDYEFVVIASTGTFRLTGDLDPEGETSNGGTLYEGVSLEVDPCQDPLFSQFDNLTLVLTLFDDIPDEQQARIGLSEYRIDIAWSLEMENSCL